MRKKIDCEILEKNGFKDIYGNKTAYLYKESEDKKVLIDLECKSASFVRNNASRKCYEGAIQYVRDLNSLLRICDIGITIK